MGLALLVYVVDLLLNLNVVLWVVFGIAVVVPCITWFAAAAGDYPADFAKGIKNFKRFFYTKTVTTVFAIAILIPSEQTMKYMGAAYLVQSTFQSEFVQETVSLSQKAVIKQLQSWAEDNTDIEQLLESVDIPVPNELKKKGE